MAVGARMRCRTRGEHAARDVPAVTFEVELSIERVVDRLDDLARRPGQPLAGTLGFAPAAPGSGAVLNAPPMTSIVTTWNANTNVGTSGSRVISFRSVRTSRPTAGLIAVLQPVVTGIGAPMAGSRSSSPARHLQDRDLNAQVPI